MNSVKETLIAVRKLLEKPENWTQGAYARDAKGVALMQKILTEELASARAQENTPGSPVN